jgi:hypothetical protein
MGRAQGRIDIGVERGSIGRRLRREPSNTDTHPFSREAAARWVVGAFTRIFFGPLTGGGARRRQVVDADTIPSGEKPPIYPAIPGKEGIGHGHVGLDRLL